VVAIPISAADYYDYFPTTAHNPGDIWVGLPTFGVLPVPHLPGLVITPACDLSNRKVETITYVPILPVSAFIVSRSAALDVKRAIEGQLEAAGLSGLLSLPEGFETPNGAELTSGLKVISEALGGPAVQDKVRRALERIASGLRILRHMSVPGPGAETLKDLQNLLGEKALRESLKRVITNARPDVHFLPADDQKREWATIPVHSLALFRYTLTLPIEIFDIAQRVSELDWSQATAKLRTVLPCVESLPVRPMKRLQLRPRFGSDLLTRYTGVFGRLGSPDFTGDTVSRFIGEIEEDG
jgi:hypothetical protein